MALCLPWAFIFHYAMSHATLEENINNRKTVLVPDLEKF
jgi:hypothetical protein